MHAEELLAAIAAATGERVCVPAERWALLLMLGLPAERLFTTDTRAARIHAVLRHTVCTNSVHTLQRKDTWMMSLVLLHLQFRRHTWPCANVHRCGKLQ